MHEDVIYEECPDCKGDLRIKGHTDHYDSEREDAEAERNHRFYSWDQSDGVRADND